MFNVEYNCSGHKSVASDSGDSKLPSFRGCVSEPICSTSSRAAASTEHEVVYRDSVTSAMIESDRSLKFKARAVVTLELNGPVRSESSDSIMVQS